MTTRESEQAVTPESIDVLCGSGQEVLEHPGTARFRAIVLQHYESTYSLAKTKTEKMKASKLIFDEIVQAGSRFLKKEPIYAFWYDAKSDKVGRDKISHLLRRIEKKKGDSRSCQRSRPPQQPSLPPNPSLSTAHGKSGKGSAHYGNQHIQGVSLLQKSAYWSQSPSTLPAQHRTGLFVRPEKQVSSSRAYGMMMTPAITLTSSYLPALVGREMNNKSDGNINTGAIVGTTASTRRRSSTHQDIELQRIIDVLSRASWDQTTEEWDATPLDKKRGDFEVDDYEPIATFQ